MRSHIDLFSGIGGFALAARWAGIQTVQFVEIDPFCRKVLQKNFPGVPIHDDIKSFTNANWDRLQKQGAEQQTSGDRQLFQNQPFLLTGGFPCQPFSCAGKRKGTSDDRHLWPHMLRVIKEFNPRWVIAENVRGLTNIKNVVEQGGDAGMEDDSDNGGEDGISTSTLVCILDDLEQAGYSVQVFLIPACGVGACHKRDRLWIVAHSESKRGGGEPEKVCREKCRQVDELLSNTINTDCHASDTTSRQRLPRHENEPFSSSGEARQERCRRVVNVTDTGNQRLQGGERIGSHEQRQATHGSITERNHAWDEPWIEAATRLCRIPHGLSEWMDENWRRINGTTSKTISRQEVSDMWDYFQSDEIQRNIRGQFPLLKKNDLLTVLCKLKAESNTQDSIPFEGKAVQEGYLRELSNQDGVGCSPQGREYKKQQRGQYNDALPPLPYEIALAAESIIRWHKLETDSANRVDRLKSLGNAIVPQVAFAIMQAIIEVDK